MQKFILTVLLFSVSITAALGQLMQAKDLYTKADSLRGELTPLRTCYDINYYHLDIQVDIENRSLTGSNLFRFTAVESFDSLQFDLFDNLSVDRIDYKGQALPFSREFNAVFVEFPETIEKGEVDSFRVFYSGQPIQATRAPWDGGFDWKTDSQGNPWVATACQGLGASVWWPNKDHQSDEVDSMLISVSVPSQVMNISNGQLVKTEPVGEGYTKYHWKVRSPINNYNVALNIGDYAHVREVYKGIAGPLLLDYYVLRENQNQIDHLKENTHRMLEAFEHWFGPYPFYEDGYKLIETAHLGMEHQSGIAYGNKYMNGYLGRDGSQSGWGLKWDFIIIHESGHEWFGNNITAKDLADMWIHESFTNYSEALFIDYFYGKSASAAYVNGNRRGIQNNAPLQGPYHVNKEGSGDMYNKGGVLHHMIRTIIDDDEKWRHILRGLNKTFYHQTVDYNDIIGYINSQIDIDLSKTFQQYVQHQSIPTLEVIQEQPGEFLIRWIAEVDGFDMPIHIMDGEGKSTRIQPTTNFQIFQFPGLEKSSFKADTYNYYIGVSIQ